MKHHRFGITFATLAMSLTLGSAGAAAMLRVSCDAADAGAEVLVNGQFKGECPVDIQVEQGMLKLRVQKKAKLPPNVERELYFEQEIRMGDGVVKKVEARFQYVLSGPPFADMQKLAIAGDASAMYGLGYAYGRGMSVPKNEALSLSWYRKAEAAWRRAANEKADTDAMIKIGDMYFEGIGVTPSDQQGASWYLKAAEAGNTRAMTGLGVLTAEGKRLKKDDAQSAAWYRRAFETLTKKASSGDAKSMYELGTLYLFAPGGAVEQSDQAATSWFRKAAEAGDTAGMYFLYLQLKDGGTGVRQDQAQALAWLRKAAVAGDIQAMDELARQSARR